MKLLLDQNLSPVLVKVLSGIFPHTAHVRSASLSSAADGTVWEYAAQHGYTIVTKDADFHHRSLLRGYPPKVIWIRLGNCSTSAIAQLLADRRDDITEFMQAEGKSFLTLA